VTAHLVRHAQVRYTDAAGDLVYAQRGDVVDVPDGTDAARLVALGALVAPGTDIAPPVDDRPWADVLQEAADRRYDTVTVP
jgi:hypothetical protein